MTFTSTRFLLYSVILHAAIAGLLFVNVDITPTKIKPQEIPNIVKATAVDNKQVEAELNRLKEIERKKQEDMERKLNEIKKKADESERKRRNEEKRLADLKKKKFQEEKKRQEEEKKLAEVKKQKEELERQRKIEEEKKQKAEQERKRLEEQKRKAEEERKRKEAEEALRKQIEAEQQAQKAAQEKQDLSIIQQYGLRIQSAIAQNFNTAGLQPGLSCVFRIRMIPGGEIIEARIVKSSGNAIFDRRAEVAVNKASPLPVPDNPRIFEKMREINLTFTPN